MEKVDCSLLIEDQYELIGIDTINIKEGKYLV